MKKYIKFLLVLLSFVILLTSCSKPTQTTPEPTQDKNTEQVQPGDISKTQRTDPILTSYVQQITTADPHKNLGILAANQILWQTFEPLVRVFSDKELMLIAESYEVSDDGLVYTFHLRRNAKFHNGDPVTADDVIWSVKRASETPYFAVKLESMKDVSKVDDHTVKLELTYANPYFMHGFSEVCIISKRAVEEAGEDYGTKAVDSGTGPYRQTFFKGDTKVELEAFPEYYLGEAAIKKATFTLIIDASTLYVAFQNGELNFTTIPESNWQEMVDAGIYGNGLMETDHTTYLLINNSRPPFDNKLVRQALNYAINREEIVLFAYENLADVAYLQSNVANVFGASLDGIEKYEYNPEKAKALLKEAGYENGFDMTLTSANIYFFEKIANAVQAQLKEVGINVKIEILEASAARAKYPVGDFDLGIMGLNVDKTVDFLYVYFDTEKGNKYMQVTDTKPLELLEAARRELDPNKRLEIYKEFNQYTNDQAFTVPLFHRYMPYAWDKDLNVELGVDYFYLYDLSWK